MFFAGFQVSVPELALGSNGYDILADATKQLNGQDEDRVVTLIVQSFTERGSTPSLSDADVRYISGLVVGNRIAIDLLDQAISKPIFVSPRIPSPEHATPAASEAIEPVFRIYGLQRICYLQARLSIRRRQWGEAVLAIDRLFRFGSMLLGAWGDFMFGVCGARVTGYGYSAAIELSLQRDADPGIIRKASRLVQKTATSGELFLDVRLRPFWNAVLEFIDHLADRADAQEVFRSLLGDHAVRETLTERRFMNLGPDKPGGPKSWYPAMTLEEQGALDGDLTSSAAKWVTDNCDAPFDKGETLRVLERSLASLLQQRTKEPRAFREYLRSLASSLFPTYRLAALLRAAAMRSLVQVESLLAGVSDREPAIPNGRLPPNVIGMVLASDVLSACHSDLSVGLIFWQASLLYRQICLTVLAIAQYARLLSVLPPDLGVLVDHGYLEALPRDPYLGDVIGYDAEQSRLFVNAAASNLAFGENDEKSWYVNVPRDA
jgi:hypothetical protein